MRVRKTERAVGQGLRADWRGSLRERETEREDEKSDGLLDDQHLHHRSE